MQSASFWFMSRKQARRMTGRRYNVKASISCFSQMLSIPSTRSKYPTEYPTPKWTINEPSTKRYSTINVQMSETKESLSTLMAKLSSLRPWDEMALKKKSISQTLADESIWERDPNGAIQSGSELSTLDHLLDDYHSVLTTSSDVLQMIELALDEDDESLISEVQRDSEVALKQSKDLYYRLLMSEEADKSSCFVELRPGAGGLESSHWVIELCKMYQGWASQSGYTSKLIDQVKNESDGLKSATLIIKGDFAYGWLKHDAGTHRFVRISPFGSAEKRHTSFVSVQVFPELSEISKAIVIHPTELKIETMRSGGSGGQHVNTTDSAVRITHIPSNISVKCQEERSQIRNKEMALSMIKAKLYQFQIEAKSRLRQASHEGLTENAWGNQIRSYVFHPYQSVKDSRTGTMVSNIDSVMQGKEGLKELLESSLLFYSSRDNTP